ncbi:hypothetical protein [Jeongeupia chitinilytica]|uniref:Uncharacterized protein n=1 Tax=Jeongeupia chitinilytica TaxID=1041641 RepID=A0ABQ3H3P8_9NEIS|nr:hypothetical protein [Jeongeupia chitinilytica]GHD68927.1 hypothetical protein GCM10007350_34870 [Jeongeupia chitinilytica]
MLPKRKLDELLPVRFRNGEQVKQFSKPCVRCGTMLQARDMEGAARLVEDHLAIAATARCPKCGDSFGIACVVDNTKRVRRVIIPAWAFGLYLRNLPTQAGELNPASAPDAARPQSEPDTPPSQPPRVEHRNVVRADELVGRYGDKPIPAWVVVDGAQLNFERVELGDRVAPGEFLLDGCLVYRAA